MWFNAGMVLEWSDAGRILAAAAAGALIGIERELHDKPAGFRTNILISIGAAIFTLLSIRLAGPTSDPTRIAAQIVTGVGFLGAGAILRAGFHVIGLTTAATIWSVASLGMAFGAGQYFIGVVGTLLVHGVLVGLMFVEPLIDRRRSVVRFELSVDTVADAEAVRAAFREHGVRGPRWVTAKSADGLTLEIEAVGPRARVERLEAALLQDARVRRLSRM